MKEGNMPAAAGSSVQEVCIDLPGEAVQCWRSSEKIRVRLRKHRDVFFEIKLQPGATYSIESKAEFYNPKEKKLCKRAVFADGERFHLWIGREFKGNLSLKAGGKLIGTYTPNGLDQKKYGPDPKAKPEPMLIIMGKSEERTSLTCTPEDRFGLGITQSIFKPEFDPKLSYLRGFGTEFNYAHTPEVPEVKEYVCVAEASPNDIQPQVLKQLDSGTAVVGSPEQIFKIPSKEQQPSELYTALAGAIGYISGNWLLTANWFKEPAGYLQEHWRSLNKLLMKVRIEKRAIGKYRVLFKGRPLKGIAAQLLGSAANAKTITQKMPLGHGTSGFVDGGYVRAGRGGYGGVKRIILTTAENFKGGMKIQIIGTIIDLIGDANTIYFDEKGSNDLTEFLGRAGVSIVKAGTTAAIGSLAAAGLIAAIIATGVALPAYAVVGVVVAGYIGAAYLVDGLDEKFDIKNTVGAWAK